MEMQGETHKISLWTNLEVGEDDEEKGQDDNNNENNNNNSDDEDDESDEDDEVEKSAHGDESEDKDYGYGSSWTISSILKHFNILLW